MDYKVKNREEVRLDHLETTGQPDLSKKEAKEILAGNVEKLEELQQIFYASSTKAILIILQGMDTSGKDGCIRHIFSGVNPQGCTVVSFKQPTALELAHDFMWRHYASLPPKGHIAIFNRSYYENVLITRVHPELLLKENLPQINSDKDVTGDFWENRFDTINAFEKQLVSSGTVILKFFLHLSKDEQKKRLIKRIVEPEKNWKFDYNDLKERSYWNQYQKAYEALLSNTSTDHAPWYAIPADNKWSCRVIIGNLLIKKMEEMNLSFPILSDQEKELLQRGNDELNNDT